MISSARGRFGVPIALQIMIQLQSSSPSARRCADAGALYVAEHALARAARH